MHRERLKGNADDDEVAEQPTEKMKLDDVENDENEQVGEQVQCFRYHAYNITEEIQHW